jgi:hypothetical protein
MAAVGSFRFKVLIGMWGIPSTLGEFQLWSSFSVRRALGESPATLRNTMISCEYYVVDWCEHPDFIPREKLVLGRHPRARGPFHG